MSGLFIFLVLPPQKGLVFPRGWGFCKAKIFKENVHWNFQTGVWGSWEKSLPWDLRYGYFLEIHNKECIQNIIWGNQNFSIL